jgi:hypothetical protein
VKLKSLGKASDEKKLPPILVASRRPQVHAGIGEKPDACLSCPWTPYSKGFVPDTLFGGVPRLALVFAFPTKDDITEREGLSGDMGGYILRNYVYPFGFKKAELLVSYVLRCLPPWSRRYQKYAYPTGRTKERAEVACRVHDKEIVKFDPNIFLITFSPREVLKVPSYRRQLLADMEKVKRLVSDGYKPLVLFGNEPAALHAPFIEGRGGSKAFRGHFWEGKYKFANDGNEGFIPG